MINVVLYEPEIPQNTGNIMRTCVATHTKLHLIKPLGFSLDEKYIKRSGVNYIDKVNYQRYIDYDDFKEHNDGEYFYFTRYGTKVDIPSVMVFRDGVLTDVYNIKEDNYNIKKLEKYLEKEVVIND